MHANHTFHIRSQMFIHPIIITTVIIIKTNYYDESLCSLFHNHLAPPPFKLNTENEIHLSVHTVDAYLITRAPIPGSINAHFGVDIQRNFLAAWRPRYDANRVGKFVVPRSRPPNVSLCVNLVCTSSEVVVGLFIFKHQYIAINDWEKKIHQETLVMESCLQRKQPRRCPQ
jgi:hypothetical protein